METDHPQTASLTLSRAEWQKVLAVLTPMQALAVRQQLAPMSNDKDDRWLEEHPAPPLKGGPRLRSVEDPDT